MVIARILMTGSAGVLLALGIVHLVYTFRGPKLTPRDPSVQQRMQQVSPVLTSETTMWKAWIGFNASHSLALILFGLIYGYLALSNSKFLFGSPILLVIGFGMLFGLLTLARLYWFSAPFWGVCLSLLCYIGSIAFSRLSLS
jgi:hypothetical protein